MEKDKAKLKEAQRLETLSRDMEDMEQWIADREKMVQDDSFKDPNKLQVCSSREHKQVHIQDTEFI